MEVELAEFLGTWNRPYWNRTVLCLTWLAHVVGGVERPGDDLAELRRFEVDELPRGAALAFSTFDSILASGRRGTRKARAVASRSDVSARARCEMRRATRWPA